MAQAWLAHSTRLVPVRTKVIRSSSRVAEAGDVWRNNSAMLGPVVLLFDRPAIASAPLSEKMQVVNLFLVGFLVLFLELSCIRWFAASVIFLQFFTNVVLIASFLGMSCGCLAARSTQDWLRIFPWL